MILLNGLMQWREMAYLQIYEHSEDERMRLKTIALRTNEWWMPLKNTLIVLVSCPHALVEISAERNEFREKKANPNRNVFRKWNRFAGIGQRQRGAQETRHRNKMFESDCYSVRVNNPIRLPLCHRISLVFFASTHFVCLLLLQQRSSSSNPTHSCKQFIPMRFRYIAPETFYLSCFRAEYFISFCLIRRNRYISPDSCWPPSLCTLHFH